MLIRSEIREDQNVPSNSELYQKLSPAFSTQHKIQTRNLKTKKIFLGNYEREDRPRREFNDDKQQIFVGGLPITMSEQDIRDVFR